MMNDYIWFSVYALICTLEQSREFIKENKKTKTRPRKRPSKQEKKKENMLSTKKAIKIKNFSFFLDLFIVQVLVFLFSYFLVFFYKFPPQYLRKADLFLSLLETAEKTIKKNLCK